MPINEDYANYILEQLSGIEGIYAKKMFGGIGYFYEDVMFAGIMDNVFRLKADETTEKGFLAYDCGPWEIKGKSMKMPYYQVPAHVLEDRKILSEWVKQAIEVSFRTRKQKKKK